MANAETASFIDSIADRNTDRGSGNNLHQLAKLSVKDLQKFKGVGEAKAVSIVSALELGRRRNDEEPQKNFKIQSSQDAYDYIKPELMDQQFEEFWLLLLKRNNEVIKKVQVSRGGVSGTVVDPKLIFKSALEELASSVILIHNHPSGSSKPSQTDIRLTRKLKSAGELLDIAVLDHLIFCNETYFSFGDESLL